MDTWHLFWQMGGYAAYVWSSYGLSFIVLIALWRRAQYRKTRALRRLIQQLSQS